MKKYDVPSTVGSYELCERYIVDITDADSSKTVAKYRIMWPKSEAMKGLLTDLVNTLNDVFEQRGLPLHWSWSKVSVSEDTQGISVQGMWFITNKISKKMVSVYVEGKTYKIDPEKLDTLLKSLE